MGAMGDFFRLNLAEMGLLFMNVVMAILMNCIVFLAYKLTYVGGAFSKKFMISLGMMTIITTTIMNVISNNVALSLGMVGALSIIRFRTAVKDTRDATYIFWCIGLGICCGVSMYLQALFGSFAIFVFLLVAGQVKDENRYLLIIRSEAAAHERVREAIKQYYGDGVILKVENSNGESGDLIFEITSRMVRKAQETHGVSAVEQMMRIAGVNGVDLVQQTDDIGK